MRALIFVNGELPDVNLARNLARPDDLLVGVDGGCLHMKQLGLKPDVIIGDLDSLPRAQMESYENEGVPVFHHPVRKDETDLELALDYVLQKGCSIIRIIAATGGRLDHSIGNISLLSHSEFRSVDIRLDDGLQEIFFIFDSMTVDGNPGDILSLLPFGSPAVGVVTENLEYPLRNETLYPDQTRGISNVFTNNSATIRLSSGKLICIHIRKTLQSL